MRSRETAHERGTPPDESAACAACASGRYQDKSAQMDCIDCKAGQFEPHVGSTACTDCDLGTRAPNASASTGCEDCAPGWFSDTRGQTTCKRCDEGRYQPSPGHESCFLCSSDSAQNETGRTSCTACAVGESSVGTGGRSVHQAWLALRGALACPAPARTAPPASIKPSWPKKLRSLSAVHTSLRGPGLVHWLPERPLHHQRCQCSGRCLRWLPSRPLPGRQGSARLQAVRSGNGAACTEQQRLPTVRHTNVVACGQCDLSQL